MTERVVGFWVAVAVHGLLLLAWLWGVNRLPAVSRPLPLTLEMFRVALPQPPVEPVTQPTAKSSPRQPDPSAAHRATNIPPEQPAASAQVPSQPRPRPPPPALAEQSRTLTDVAPTTATTAPPKALGQPQLALESDYLAAVRAAIEAHKFYPQRARWMGVEGTVGVRFALARDGTLESLSLESGSGSRDLDLAALAAVRRVGAFPAFPADLDRGRWEMVLSVDFALAR